LGTVPAPAAYDAVVLAGGTSRRMGGGDKTQLVLDGVALLDRALDAVSGAQRLIVVGPSRALTRQVCWTQEQPAGAGPAAALAAGLAEVTAPLVVVLAADLPFVTAETVRRLLSRADPAGAVLVDGHGSPQWLLGAWPAAKLRAAFSGEQAGQSLRRGLEPLDPVRLGAEADLPEWLDCDRPDDLVAAKELLDERAGRLAR
jgi:molybdenum cofactor guanylyltransferase